ncbi:MAG: RsiV family protein [Prevotellaceae bacterium]|jgi:hypothetical protein|nr:RsiV family protein [Prevotellaceae bacterium]
MRKICVIFCVAAIAVSCFSGKGKFNDTVDFEKITVEKNSRDVTSDSSYKVSLTYYAPTGVPEFLKDSIQKHTKFLFAAWFDVKGEFDLNVSVQKHFDEYFRQIAKNNLPAHTFFVLNISPDEIYQNKHVISLAYNWTIYEGGAHPNHGKFCFVIDKNSGEKVNFNSLVKGHEAEFLEIAKAEFKAQSGIKENEEIYSVYRFKDNEFHLTDNYTFTPSGLVFCYNPYDIAPYSFGLIELIIPYEKIKDLINISLK